LLRIEGPLALLERLGNLALLSAPGPTQAVERGMRRSAMKPRRCVLCRRRVEPVEVDENVLRHVLRLVRIGQDAIRDAYYTSVCAFDRLFKAASSELALLIQR